MNRSNNNTISVKNVIGNKIKKAIPSAAPTGIICRISHRANIRQKNI